MEQNFLRIAVKKITHTTSVSQVYKHKEKQQDEGGPCRGWFGLENYTKLP